MSPFKRTVGGVLREKPVRPNSVGIVFPKPNLTYISDQLRTRKEIWLIKKKLVENCQTATYSRMLKKPERVSPPRGAKMSFQKKTTSGLWMHAWASPGGAPFLFILAPRFCQVSSNSLKFWRLSPQELKVAKCSNLPSGKNLSFKTLSCFLANILISNLLAWYIHTYVATY
jgi:hypothetical protein